MRLLIPILATTLLAAGLLLPLAADTVETAAGQLTDVTVAGLSPEGIKLADGRRLAAAGLRRIRCDRFPVAPQAQGLTLKDGTRLCGIVRAWDDPLRFRSVALGEISIPREDLAVVWFRGAGAKVPADSPTTVVEASGTAHPGRIFWTDGQSAGVRTDAGLQRIPMDGVAYVVLAPPGDARRLTLRNDDIINFPASWRDDTVVLRYRDQELNLPFAAIREINLTADQGGQRP